MRLYFVITFAIGIIVGILPSHVSAQNQWVLGQIVGLKKGTCIRQGDGFSWQAHTIVPEDNWLVRIKGGPRTTDGRIWWDIDRKAAGDNYGGTGWVTQDQSDTNCNNSSPSQNNPSPPQSNPSAPQIPQSFFAGVSFQTIQSMWFSQPAWVKVGVALLALLSIRLFWRLLGGVVWQIVRAGIAAFVLFVVFDLTRDFWSSTWYNVARPIFRSDIPDLEVLIGLLPFASLVLTWFGRILRRS